MLAEKLYSFNRTADEEKKNINKKVSARKQFKTSLR